MAKKFGVSLIRLVFLAIPALFVMVSTLSFISSCSRGGDLTNCTNSAPTANQQDCDKFAQTYQCSGNTFDGTTCTITGCLTCTCSGDVTAITNLQTCIQYAQDNRCLNADIQNGVCQVTECLNCEAIVDDTDFVTDGTDDAGFFI